MPPAPGQPRLAFVLGLGELTRKISARPSPVTPTTTCPTSAPPHAPSAMARSTASKPMLQTPGRRGSAYRKSLPKLTSSGRAPSCPRSGRWAAGQRAMPRSSSRWCRAVWPMRRRYRLEQASQRQRLRRFSEWYSPQRFSARRAGDHDARFFRCHDPRLWRPPEGPGKALAVPQGV
jgi:hypothetical protein